MKQTQKQTIKHTDRLQIKKQNKHDKTTQNNTNKKNSNSAELRAHACRALQAAPGRASLSHAVTAGNKALTRSAQVQISQHHPNMFNSSLVHIHEECPLNHCRPVTVFVSELLEHWDDLQCKPALSCTKPFKLQEKQLELPMVPPFWK